MIWFIVWLILVAVCLGGTIYTFIRCCSDDSPNTADYTLLGLMISSAVALKVTEPYTLKAVEAVWPCK